MIHLAELVVTTSIEVWPLENNHTHKLLTIVGPVQLREFSLAVTFCSTRNDLYVAIASLYVYFLTASVTSGQSLKEDVQSTIRLELAFFRVLGFIHQLPNLQIHFSVSLTSL